MGWKEKKHEYYPKECEECGKPTFFLEGEFVLWCEKCFRVYIPKSKSGREETIEDVTNILTGHIGHAINKDAIDGIVHYIHVLLGQKDGSDDCAHEAARRLNLKERKEAKNMSLPSVEKVREVLDLAEKYDKEAEDLRKIIEALQVQGYPPKSISTGTHTLNLNQEDRLRGKIATVISEHREDIIGKRDDYIRQISELKGEGW